MVAFLYKVKPKTLQIPPKIVQTQPTVDKTFS